jgi:DegV family protein with EDD domain
MPSPEQRLHIVTDSACSLHPADQTSKTLDITVVPHLIFHDGYSLPASAITHEEFYSDITYSQDVTTTAPTIPDFFKAYKNLDLHSGDVLSLHIANDISETLGNAKTAAGRYMNTVYVRSVDTKTVGPAARLVVQKAAMLAQDIRIPHNEIFQQIEEMIPNIDFVATINHMDILDNGPRHHLEGTIFEALSLHALVTMDKKNNIQPHKVTSSEISPHTLLEYVPEQNSLASMVIFHTGALWRARQLSSILGLFQNDGEKTIIPIVDAGPTIAAHTGPGMVGVAWERK